MHTNIYLERYAHAQSYINVPPSPQLALSVVIPAYNEPDVVSTLSSVRACTPVPCETEVIVVFNYSDADGDEVRLHTHQQYEKTQAWVQKNPTERLTFHLNIEKDIRRRIAGPGIARKIGMDEAVKRFESLGNVRGIIASLDADCIVQSNYLQAIYQHWIQHPHTTGVSIFFEHPLTGQMNAAVYRGIAAYELHLRYYIDAQRMAGFPWAFQTVGSSFAVSSVAYQKQGGMNKRKAGEDFYFLQRIIPLGNYYDLTTTTVYPSPRPSDRVPFGTGRSISDFLAGKGKVLTTYHIEIFRELSGLIAAYGELFHCDHADYEYWLKGQPPAVRDFLENQEFWKSLQKINANVSNKTTFAKAFFGWFDAFRLMKFVHFARDTRHPNQPVEVAANALLQWQGRVLTREADTKELLHVFREQNRTAPAPTLLSQAR